ncbi:hypothetical protein F4808DRAFT_330057 [Astrocystis sublimbata]|nr:hypothetical protein F4808DRAFT_330057 [Astrocystis sublimbata]
MSPHEGPEDQQNITPPSDTFSEESENEDAFTASRPPQYNNSNQVPQTMMGDRSSPETDDVGAPYSALSHTDSTETVQAGNATSTPAPIRDHILHHINHDYDSEAVPLTEQAVATLDHALRNMSYGSDIGGWARARLQFPPSDPADLSLSLLRNPRERPDSTVCSSLSKVSSNTPSGSQEEQVAELISGAGLHLADVPPIPTGPDLLDEDLM